MKETHTIKSMFDGIVERYDFLNHTLSFFQDYYWRRAMVRELLPVHGSRVMDLATGTGDSARGLINLGFTVIGADLSFRMIAKTKGKFRGAGFIPVTASAYELPFHDAAVDGLVCAFGIRNMHDTVSALREIYRVLKPGTSAVFLEFSMPRGVFRIPYRLYLRTIMPRIAALFSRRDAYDYLWESIENFHTPDAFSTRILAAGFTACERRPMSFGTVYIHKAYKL